MSGDEEEALDSLLRGSPAIPVTTYFSLGRHSLPERVIKNLNSGDGNVCENLIFLGKRATMKTSEGIRIVNLGGSLNTNIPAGLSKEDYSPFHTEVDAKSLFGAHSTDILTTYSWPSSIQNHSNVNLSVGGDKPDCEQGVSDLCVTLKPRYHFSSSTDVFFEREPFFHLDQNGQPDINSITRFISLAAYGSPSKQKWLYAFSISAPSENQLSLPPGTTASPLSISKQKRPHHDQDNTFSRFSGPSTQRRDNNRSSKRSRHKAPPPGPEECFFCLSNPSLATHFITSIGNESYLTTAKGPLTTSSTFPSLNFPAHILIIPLSHSPTIASISPPETGQSTNAEMTRYRKALEKTLFVKAGAKLGAVTWEVSRANGIHVHWQFLPVQRDLIQRGLVEGAFKVEAENEKYPTFKEEKEGKGKGGDMDFFRIWIWDPERPAGEEGDVGSHNQPRSVTSSFAGKERELVLPLPMDTRFDLQFGRRVMAKLLGLEARLQWRECNQDEEEEKADAENFKSAFKEFDFSIEEA